MSLEINDQIDWVDPHLLKQHPDNNNKHTDEQIDRLAEILKYQGMRSPVIVNKKTMHITKGNATTKAVIKNGWSKIPVIFQEYQDEQQEYAHLTSDNEIARWAELDLKELKIKAKTFEMDFNLDLYGIKDFELEQDKDLNDEKADEIPDTDENEFGVELGDIWQLGDHRVMCGDSTCEETVSKLMNGEKADMVHTDPPYNVDYSNQDRPNSGKKDLGRIKNDKMSSDSFYEFLLKSMSRAYEATKEDSMIYVWHASAEQINFNQSLIESGWSYSQQVIWKKPMLLGRNRYQWAHEPCLTGVKGRPYFTDDRTKTTVWDFGGYDKSKNIHPTQKPVFIPEEAINNSSKIGSNVLDLFLGSGSTLIACEKTNRKCFGMELDPHYCSVIIKRWQDYTGKKAEKLNG